MGCQLDLGPWRGGGQTTPSPLRGRPKIDMSTQILDVHENRRQHVPCLGQIMRSTTTPNATTPAAGCFPTSSSVRPGRFARIGDVTRACLSLMAVWCPLLSGPMRVMVAAALTTSGRMLQCNSIPPCQNHLVFRTEALEGESGCPECAICPKEVGHCGKVFCPPQLGWPSVATEQSKQGETGNEPIP